MTLNSLHLLKYQPIVELNDLYSSLNNIRVIKSWRTRWTEHVARMGERRGVYKLLVGKPEGNRPLCGGRHIRENNITMDLQWVGWGVDWIDLAQDRTRWLTLLNAPVNLWVRWNAGNFLTSRKWLASQEGLGSMGWHYTDLIAPASGEK